MTKRTTKRALLASALSLLLCVSMLIGTTFAWFTDSVTSTNNIIKAGNLDVELEYSTDMSTWTKVDTNTNIFKNGALWEPGYTEVVYLRVSNVGSLALKYRLGVNVASEIIGKTEAGVDIKLSDYIEYGVIENVTAAYDADQRMTARADIAAASKLNVAYEKEYALVGKTATATDTDTFALVVYMPESVGNEANHNGTDKPVINLGLSVVATQNTVEEDSFDDQYDKDAPIAWLGETDMDWYLADPTASVFEVSTAEELAGLAAIVNGTAEGIAQDSFSGQTIKLTSDIDLGNLSWDTIGRKHVVEGSDPFKGTFDGQGHTVYNLNIYIEDDQRDSVGFIGYAENAKIKGLTIENVSINADYFVGAIVGKLASGEIYDCHVKGEIDIVARTNYVAGIVSDGYYRMEKCSVIADGMGSITSKAVAGGLCGRNNEGANYIKNCTVKNLDIRSGQQIAAITGFAHYGNIISGCNAENVNLTLTDTSVATPSIGLASGLWFYVESAPITISDNTFKNITISAINDVKGVVNILHGCEWNDRLTGVVESNNTMDNITNNLNYVQ